MVRPVSRPRRRLRLVSRQLGVPSASRPYPPSTREKHCPPQLDIALQKKQPVTPRLFGQSSKLDYNVSDMLEPTERMQELEQTVEHLEESLDRATEATIEGLQRADELFYETLDQEYQPTPEQLARAASLRRYNNLYVLTPILTMGISITVVAVILLYATIVDSNNPQWRLFTSALADLVIIVSVIPLTLACILLPAMAVGLYMYDRDRQYTRTELLQRLLWRVDSKMGDVRDKTAEVSPKVAEPVIKMNSTASYIGVLLRRLKRLLFGD